jgi:hypothetical protein
MSTLIRKNLVIGLGGTGLNAVYALKRKYQSVFGTQRPIGTRFLVFDTTDFQPSGGVTLEPSEFIKLEVGDAAAVLQKNPNVSRWFPREPPIPLGSINTGAAQLRPLGRLALFHNAERVLSGIHNAIDQMESIDRGTKAEGMEVSPQDPLIQVIGSLSGGTGAGTFLDVGHITRSKMTKGVLFGMFLLPDIFKGKPATGNVEANAYAALKELDYYMEMSEGLPSYGIIGDKTVPITTAPFNKVYLINNRNGDGLAFTEMADIAEQMAMAAYLAAGGAGKEAGDVFDNDMEEIFGGKRGHYRSVGVSELVLDRTLLAEELALGAAYHQVQKCLLLGSEGDFEMEVEGFLEANSLIEHERDQLIDALLPPSRAWPSPPLDGIKGRKDLGLLRAVVDDYPNQIRSQAKDLLVRSRAEFEQASLRRFEQHVRGLLGRAGGLPDTITFLNQLLGRLEAFRDEMNRESGDLGAAASQLRPIFEQVLSDAKERMGSIFTGSGAVKELVDQVDALLRQERQGLVESMRRVEAAGVYSALIGVVRQKLETLRVLRENLELVERRLSRELEELKGKRKKDSPFQIPVEVPEILRSLDIAPAEILSWLQAEGMEVQDLTALGADELTDKIKSFGRTRPGVEKVRSLTIDAVLSAVGPEQRMRYLSDLDRKATPMWRFDAAPVNAVKPARNQFLFGVPKSDESAVDMDEIRRAISMSSSPAVVELGDPERVYVFKVEAGIPAFAVEGMHGYKLAYESRRKTIPLHLEQEFAKDPKRDLFPEVGGTEALKAWSLGNARVFGLIQRNGAHYLIRSERKGGLLDDYMVPLGQGRINASEAFMGDQDLVAEVLERIGKVKSSIGAAAVVGELRGHAEELRALGQSASDKEVKSLISSELEAINTYITEQTTVV